jgi:hypothetical protein
MFPRLTNFAKLSLTFFAVDARFKIFDNFNGEFRILLFSMLESRLE